MSNYAHKGQILPLVNQMIPISKDTTFHASYDYGLHGFNQGEVVTPQGQDRSLDFSDGTFIRISPSEKLDTFAEQTISAWIYPTVAGASYGPIVCKWDWDVGNYRSYELLIANTGDLTYAVSSNGIDAGVTSIKTMDYPKNQWVHVAATYASSGTIAIYVNGVLKVSAAHTGGIFSTDRSLLIASFRSGTFGNWKGKISEVGVWGRALTVEEIASLSFQSINTDDPELRGYWKLNEREGPISFDHSGNGNDGMWNGTLLPSHGPTVATLQKEEGKFRGGVLIEPEATNLLYDNGLFNGTFVNLTVTPTVNVISPNRRYNIKTSASTSGSTIRFKVPLSKLVNGATYTMSYKYRIIKGTRFLMGDWCDYPVIRTEIDYGDYRYQTASGSRPTYDETFRFMDIYVDPESEIEVWDIQLEERDTATSFTDGHRPVGKLWYPTASIEPNAFTISCWFNIPYMHRVSQGNLGINGTWHHPIMEIVPTIDLNSVGYTIMAGPEPASFSRKLMLRAAGDVTSPFQVQDDTWYHLVATYDGTTHRIYIDGTVQLEVVKNMPAIPEGSVLMVGGGYQGKPFIKIDELRIESRAISEEEAAAWAASGLHYNYLDYSLYVD